MAEAISADKALNPQGKHGSGQLAIRDDGMLMEANERILKEPNWRMYYGDPNASIEERVNYVRSQHTTNRAAYQMETGAFNVAVATREQLIDFAAEEYGARLDPKMELSDMRRMVMDMAGKAAPPPALAPKPVNGGITAGAVKGK